MSLADLRHRLAARQTELVSALAGTSCGPTEFDRERLRAAAQALERKRARAVARVWPGLARDLGERFGERFAAFAANRPLPRRGGPLADGRAFARMLAEYGELANAGRLEALAVDLDHAPCAGGLRPRRGLVVRVALLRNPRHLVVALRLPRLGKKWISLSIGRLIGTGSS